MTSRTNPVVPFLDSFGVMILDGGLATELEVRGCDLRDDLWSARVLLDDPGIIRSVHADYLEAGADVIATTSYQATVEGFRRRGIDTAEVVELLQGSVRLAVESRDVFWQKEQNRVERLRPLVAASVGPYGAFLADGSEYSGTYDLDRDGLLSFHRHRWQVLVESDADLLACETIPSHAEGQVLLQLLRDSPDVFAWFSFSCRDERHISDGTPLFAMAEELADERRVAAIGVNCTSPRLVAPLIAELARASDKPIVVYPNSGETYDSGTKGWFGETDPIDFAGSAVAWRDLGARLIGGCCRTGPEHVRAIRRALTRSTLSG